MYPIDLTTASMAAVIARSATCHPTLLAECCETQAAQHAAYAGISTHGDVAQIACGMATALRATARSLRNGRRIVVRQAAPVFAIACRLQCIPRHIEAEIELRTAKAARRAAA